MTTQFLPPCLNRGETVLQVFYVIYTRPMPPHNLDVKKPHQVVCFAWRCVLDIKKTTAFYITPNLYKCLLALLSLYVSVWWKLRALAPAGRSHEKRT